MKQLAIFLFFIFLQIQILAQEKPTLIYFGDPMCSWCYGFSPEYSKALKALENKAETEIIMGGLRPYNTEVMTDLADFLKHHWEEVGKRSGQHFSYSILNKSDIRYDTEPACWAVVVVKTMQPEIVFSFFKKVQTAFYSENKDPNLTETFVEIAGGYNLDKNKFRELFESEEIKEATREEFAFSGEMGVRGFPTVVLKHGEELVLISNGYTEAENLIEKINKVIE